MTSWFRRRPSEVEPGVAAPVGPPPITPQPPVSAEVFGPEGIARQEFQAQTGRLLDALNAMDSDVAADILVVVPPPHTGDPQRRLHRPVQELMVRVGPYEVVGQVHVPPGAQATGYLARVNPSFAALTQAVVRRTDGAMPERHVEVVLANLRAADRVRAAAVRDAEQSAAR